MSPPTTRLAFTSGGTKSTDGIDKLIVAAHGILDACGYPLSQSKVSKLVRRFRYRVENNGFAFFDFIANAIQLTEAQRRNALSNPDVARCIAYADPTGETAVNNVMMTKRSSLC